MEFVGKRDESDSERENKSKEMEEEEENEGEEEQIESPDFTKSTTTTAIQNKRNTATVVLPQYCGEIDQTKLPPVERVVFPRDIIEITEEDESVYIVGTRDGKVTVIDGLDHIKQLKTLVLRSCLISRMEGVEQLIHLEKLELYDNQIEEISAIHRLSQLRILDLSFNAIREIGKVGGGGGEGGSFSLASAVPLLEELYLAQNKLRKIEGLEGLIHLRILDLGANRIRIIEGLETNIALQSLWLGKNKIEKITGLETLTELRQLDIQNNRLTSLGEGLKNLHHLQELYLACNRIPSLLFTREEGTEGGGGKGFALPSPNELLVIDLSTNGLSSLEGAEQLTQLEEFWLSSSAFHSYDDLQPLFNLQRLKCIYLEHSPIAKDFEYRKILAKMLPNLEQLDDTSLSPLNLFQKIGRGAPSFFLLITFLHLSLSSLPDCFQVLLFCDYS